MSFAVFGAQADDLSTEEKAALEARMAEFRAAQQRRLVKRGIALWNQAEAAHVAAVRLGAPPTTTKTD